MIVKRREDKRNAINKLSYNLMHGYLIAKSAIWRKYKNNCPILLI
jgi:hypothetical protein